MARHVQRLEQHSQVLVALNDHFADQMGEVMLHETPSDGVRPADDRQPMPAFFERLDSQMDGIEHQLEILMGQIGRVHL